ncbi:hypothetical protein JCM3765_003129 [Sporobolomyces pararoseus]
MSQAPAAVLVPDTPTATAEQHQMEDSAVGDSYLYQFVHNPHLSPTTQHSTISHEVKDYHSTLDRSSGSTHSQRRGVSPSDQHSRIDNSQHHAGSHERATSSAGSHGRKLSASNSQPVEGPGGCGEVSELGYLGIQTQMGESLDASWNKRRRISDGETRRRKAEEMEDEGEEGSSEVGTENGDISARAAGTTNIPAGQETEEETDQLASSVEEDETQPGAGGKESVARDSQKENASFPRSSLAPQKSSAPFALRSSNAHLDPSASAPSSSPAVAAQLLNRSPAKRPSKTTKEPTSTADSDATDSSKAQSKDQAGDASWDGDVSVSGSSRPLTSTPGIMKAFPPAPAPTQALASANRTRSIPTYQFVSKEPASELAPALPAPHKSRSLPSGGTATASGVVPDLALFGSSAQAMAKPAPKGKKKKEEWDGISQDTPEDQRKTSEKKEEVQQKEKGGFETQETEPEFSPTQIHEEEDEPEKTQDVSMEEEEEEEQEEQERDPTPKPTAERTVDMELDEGESNGYLFNGNDSVEGGGGGTLDTSTINGDVNSPSQEKESLRAEERANDSSNELPPPPRNQVKKPLFVPPVNSGSTSSSPSTSQRSDSRLDSSAQEPTSKKRLSDISELRSSQEFAPTQFEVEATQQVYDAEKSQMSVNSVDMDVTNSATWHAPFANDDSTSNSHSRQRSNPIPGRGLRRVPPPPTPVVQQPSTSSSSSAAQQSLPMAEDSFQPVKASSPNPPVASSSSANPGFNSNSQRQPSPAVENSLALPIPPPHFSRSDSPLQATQQVAESSPDVPLAKRTSANSLTSNRRQPTRSPSRPPPPPPQLSDSSNRAIIPDSEDPTQSMQEEERKQVQRPSKAASPSKKKRAVAEQEDSDDEPLTDLEEISLEEMIASSRRRSRSSKSVDSEEPVGKKKTKENGVDRKGKGKAEEVIEEDEEVDHRRGKKRAASKRVQDSSAEESEGEKEPEKVVKKAKAKGKGKEKEKQTPVAKKKRSLDEEAAESKTKAGKRVVKGKGKGKKQIVEESSDEEDAEEDVDSEREETNYSDQPRGRKNSKKPSPKKVKPVVVVAQPTRTKSRRKASGPSIVEATDDEEDEAIEQAAPSRRKRKTSPPPAGSKTASKRSRRSNSTSASTTTTKPAPAKKSSVSRSRRSTTTTPARSSRSVEPSAAAGPSRLRFADQANDQQPAEDDLEQEEAEDEDEEMEEGEEEVDTKPSISSRLPSSAPFSRCFGLWRDDGYYYSGTITSVTKEFFNVKFDDGSNGKLRPEEVRRCELEKGDWVQYCGGERGDTQTQTERLNEDFRVLKVNKAGDGEEAEGQLDRGDVIVAIEAANYEQGEGEGGRRTQNFLVEAVRILRTRAATTFNDRKVTPAEMDLFEGRSRNNLKPLPLLPAPTRPDVAAFQGNDSNSGLFGRMAFIVTYSGNGRVAFLDKLRDAGGTIIESDHLLEVRVNRQSGKPQVNFASNDFADIDTILLLADRPTTTKKYLMALALGIPCCSIEFAHATVKAGTRIDWEPYLLASGYLDPIKSFGVGGQLRALRKQDFDLKSLERAQQGEGVFKDQSFLVIVEKPGKSREDKTNFNSDCYVVLSLLASCSASKIDFLYLPFDSNSGPLSKPFTTSSSPSSELIKSLSLYTHVFIRPDEPTNKLESSIKPLLNNGGGGQHKGIVNMNWIKQCLITGTLLPPERIKTSIGGET